MIKDILEESEINQIADKNTKALLSYAKIYNEWKNPKTKHIFISPIKNAGFTMKQASNLDFKVSFNLWKSCSNPSIRNKGGRPKLNSYLCNTISTYLKENSSLAANRYLKRQLTNARYCNNSKLSLYNSFPSKDKVSITTFKSKMGLIYKKPHR
jgi:hypothetical protein